MVEKIESDNVQSGEKRSLIYFFFSATKWGELWYLLAANCKHQIVELDNLLYSDCSVRCGLTGVLFFE